MRVVRQEPLALHEARQLLRECTYAGGAHGRAMHLEDLVDPQNAPWMRQP